MGAFNVLRSWIRCSMCGRGYDARVQFKYGDVWQHEYEMGQSLRWGGNDVGRPVSGVVHVTGVPEGVCPHCGYEELWCEIIVRAGRIIAVVTYDGSVRPEPEDEFYLE